MPYCPRWSPSRCWGGRCDTSLASVSVLLLVCQFLPPPASQPASHPLLGQSRLRHWRLPLCLSDSIHCCAAGRGAPLSPCSSCGGLCQVTEGSSVCSVSGGWWKLVLWYSFNLLLIRSLFPPCIALCRLKLKTKKTQSPYCLLSPDGIRFSKGPIGSCHPSIREPSLLIECVCVWGGCLCSG